MATSDVKVIKNGGGLGRTDATKDHISGLLAYVDTIPATFGGEGVKLITSTKVAESYGINQNSDDETTATATITVTGEGAQNDIITVAFAGTVLGTYVVGATPTTTTVATGIKDAINTLSAIHGYSATSAGAVVTITAKKGFGISINTESLLVTHSGTTTSTQTAFTGGVGSVIDVIFYHISEFFRMKPDGLLYVGLYEEPITDIDFEEIKNIQTFANGDIRQIGIWQKKHAFATSQLGVIQGIVDELYTLHTPLEVVYSAEISGTSTITDLPNLQGLTSEAVMVTIGQDGNNVGNRLFDALGKSIGQLGVTLGSIASADVATSIAYVGGYNIGVTAELQETAFANSTLLSTVDENTKDILSNRQYVFITKRIGIEGTYFNTSSTATSQSSDFSTMENNRTIDKASRELRKFMLPLLNSKLFVNSDGTLNFETISTFQVAGNRALQNMVNSQEISAFSITIDEKQNVLSTSKIVIVATVIPVGVAKNIEIPLSYAIQLS